MSLAAHLRVLREAWARESERRGSRQQTWIESEFLPAALEVTETPPPPLGRIILWVIVAAAIAALGWSVWAKVDTVAVAEGRIVPSGQLRTVEAADTGIVREIAVREGDRVSAGQLLIALDPTVAEADAATAQSEFRTAGLVQARAAALLASADGASAQLRLPPGADPAAVAAEQALVDARVSEFVSQRGALEARRIAAQAAVRVVDANLRKIEESLPLVRQQVAAYETLAAKGYGSRLRLAQEQERLVGLTQEREAERARRDEATAQVASLSRELEQTREAFRGQAAREATDAGGIIATRGEQVRKAEQRQALQRLRAPVAGVVQEVAVTTLGQIAEAGKPLVTIVPAGESLVAEVLILNRDIGSVAAGDAVAVKLEAYPFTEHGTLSGRILRISPDAVVDERRGLVFPATVALADPSRRSMRLAPGMAVVAEVITGQRRVLQFVLSPLSKAAAEAGRER
jgi:hemolysin D